MIRKFRAYLKTWLDSLWGLAISVSNFEVVIDAEFWGTCNRGISQRLDLLGYLSLLVSGSFFLKTHKVLKVIYICINTSMECVMCTSQLKIIFLFFVWVGKMHLLTLVCLDSITKPLFMPHERKACSSKSWKLCRQQDLLCLIQSQSCSHSRGISMCPVVFLGFFLHVCSQDFQEFLPN